MVNTKKSSYLSIFGIILAVGLMASAFILGNQFKNLRETGVITVKGLAEAEHKATVGTWKVRIYGWGATYADAMKDNQYNLNQAVHFLEKKGFLDKDREITDLSVSQRIEYYTDDNGKSQQRYNGFDATRNIIISTKDLFSLQRALVEIQQLRADNQAISFDSPDYYLENLEQIKRELIAKATKDAYVRAKEFAQTSGVSVGVLKSASQGSFNIKSTRPGDDNSDYGGSYDTTTIDKKVRLVVTIKYAIDG
ncbi:SIMPL domain-containing protein [Phocoenobacter atlanticus]|uniref:SIMPL domain-containing protein n=1 Tax=Phocoenobacter atlanticus TaxID=3416742 RepID=UPI00277306A8|nr:SIMPL domain-containing protein [Pasteurella atlantica]MDP8100486.1 SIMPL domain-containing protein [Pasteurella atlantica]